MRNLIFQNESLPKIVEMNFKQEAAKMAVIFIQNGFSVGLGAGATMAYMVDYLREAKPDIQLYTSSSATKILLQQKGFQVNDIVTASYLDIYFDGCDQFDKDLNALKSGGGIHTMEKLLASMAKEFVLVGDESKYAEQLGTKYPLVIEVLPQAISFVTVEVKKLFANTKMVTCLDSKTNQPVLTGNGNCLIDIWFTELPELSHLNPLLKTITGVIETSLFFNMATKAIVAGAEGTTVKERK